MEQVVKIWDGWIRIFHWSLATAVILMLYSGQTAGDFFQCYHDDIGEIVATILIFRVLWGLFGSSNVTFLALVRNPLSIPTHFNHIRTRNVPAERGHNAAGSWAVLLILGAIGFQAFTGFFIISDDYAVEGALHESEFGQAMAETLYDWHQINGTFLLWVVGVHMLMVPVYFFVGRQNLLGPMFSGKMTWPAAQALPVVKFKNFWLGMFFCVVALIIGGWLGGWNQEFMQCSF